jgi:hypothetical protein
MLDDLRDEQVRDRLRAIWTAPAKLDPAAETARVTREIADLLATVARRIEKRGHDAETTSGFLMRILFTMFAEDSNLIPEGSFTSLLKNQRAHAPRPTRRRARLQGQARRHRPPGARRTYRHRHGAALERRPLCRVTLGIERP